MYKFLVNIAYKKAELYESQGNTSKVDYWINLAILAEKMYIKIEKYGLDKNFKIKKGGGF